MTLTMGAGYRKTRRPKSICQAAYKMQCRISTKSAFGEVQSMAFHNEKVKDFYLFRTAFDGYMGVYCNNTFKQAVEANQLKGLIFSSDIGTVFPPDANAQHPSKH